MIDLWREKWTLEKQEQSSVEYKQETAVFLPVSNSASNPSAMQPVSQAEI